MAGFVQMIHVYLLFREDIKGNNQQIRQLNKIATEKLLAGIIEELHPIAKFFSRKDLVVFFGTRTCCALKPFFFHGWQVDQKLLSFAINACENAQQWPLALQLLKGGGVFGLFSVIFSTWRIIPVSKCLATPMYKPFRPLGRGTTLLRGLTNHT